MTEEITPVQGIRNNVSHLLAAIEGDGVTVISVECHVWQGADDVEGRGLLESFTGEREYSLHYKFYNPNLDRAAGDSGASILPCDKCGMKGRRAAGKTNNRGSLFHEADCPYQLEKDAEEAAAIAAIKEADND